MDENWKSDLEGWLAPFLGALRRKVRARICPAYVAGLIGAGDRKSIQPMAARDGGVGYDQLHHFIAGGVWDVVPLEKALLAEAWLIVDDTALPKKDERSVGVALQYASALGKRELPDIGVADAGFQRGADHGGVPAVPARALDERSHTTGPDRHAGRSWRLSDQARDRARRDRSGAHGRPALWLCAGGCRLWPLRAVPAGLSERGLT